MHTENSTAPILEVRGLKVAYGGIQAVKGIDLQVRKGELVSLIGANGAGKTTTLNTLAGVVPHNGGEILYAGEQIGKLPSHLRLRKGLALVPEGRGIFTRLTVAENLQTGAYTRRDTDGIAADMEKVFALLPRVKERLNQVAGTLSGGEQQMVAIGRALLSRPQLLLLDEPSMGLAPLVVEKIFEVIHSITREGMGVLLVEQNANLALEVSERAYVMEGGLVTLEGTGKALLDDPKVRSAYLGEDIEELAAA
ncbi:branched-chain amino acid ABC transporter ATP-binding protein [Azoarcus sp. CIB]|uniref:ABC transporter ATP-binding protein n=1 Tax=Aromatoleum sp. (strain CIB) TaxID=198107 RepID=UPI00067E09CF|nr:ABC transporter ATP-binding protein [Azoarcus sp. CIB]AKU13629.1 branched-chain amino acid ABC transporter ATP-binding protein [Azoarcus sp. CIB]